MTRLGRLDVSAEVPFRVPLRFQISAEIIIERRTSVRNIRYGSYLPNMFSVYEDGVLV